MMAHFYFPILDTIIKIIYDIYLIKKYSVISAKLLLFLFFNKSCLNFLIYDMIIESVFIFGSSIGTENPSCAMQCNSNLI